jgi:soluble lytic murein transglycosylase-like protein
MKLPVLAVLMVASIVVAPAAGARTVHRCVLDGTVSLSTAPEPGSRCEAVEVDDADPRRPNLWGALGVVSGNLYRREQDGRTVYGTRELPGSVKLQSFVVETPAAVPAYAGKVGPPRLDRFAAEFAASAKASGVEDAWLRAIAHAESGFDPRAESHKGAMGVMQLMPATAAEYGVDDPFAAAQSIRAGAQHLGMLMRLYGGDLTLVAAAYNAGVGTLARYGGVPPYPETQTYVARVLALHQRYREALGTAAQSRHAG